VNASGRELQERMREAVAKGGATAALDALAGMGVAVEKEPEPGVGMRTRSGAGTEDAFTTTTYADAAERPAGWPADSRGARLAGSEPRPAVRARIRQAASRPHDTSEGPHRRRTGAGSRARRAAENGSRGQRPGPARVPR
jgi:hypothetical protein